MVVAAAFLLGWWLGHDRDRPRAPSDVELRIDTRDLTLLPSASGLRAPDHEPVPYHELVPRLSEAPAPTPSSRPEPPRE